MRNDKLGWVGLALAAVIGVAGCGDGDVPYEFPSNQGQPAKGETAYPPGPYGINPGSIIANYQFVGFPNAMESTAGLTLIQLADFYNPDGVSTYPEGSPYGAGPKPQALLIDVSSVWCPPCNHEANVVLPPLYAQYAPKGEFLLQLADGPTPGIAAESYHLYNWTQKYDVNYPASIDPTYKLSSLFESDAFPANIIVKTKDMTIVKVIAGAPDPTDPMDTFWPTFEQVMNGEL